MTNKFSVWHHVIWHRLLVVILVPLMIMCGTIYGASKIFQALASEEMQTQIVEKEENIAVPVTISLPSEESLIQEASLLANIYDGKFNFYQAKQEALEQVERVLSRDLGVNCSLEIREDQIRLKCLDTRSELSIKYLCQEIEVYIREIDDSKSIFELRDILNEEQLYKKFFYNNGGTIYMIDLSEEINSEYDLLQVSPVYLFPNLNTADDSARVQMLGYYLKGTHIWTNEEGEIFVNEVDE